MDGDAPASSLAAPGSTTSGYSPDRPKVTRVVAAKVSVGAKLTQIWASRDLLVKLIHTEIKVKYKNSALGVAWSMVAPAVSLLIYWLVFGVIFKNPIPNFVIYLFSGMILWNFFQTSLQTSTGVIVERAGIVKKVAFPREILILASVGTAVVYLFFQTLVLIAFMVLFRAPPDFGVIWLLPLALVTEVVVAVALGLILSAVNVYARDMRHLIEIFLNVWFFACPIVYSYWAQIHSRLAAHGLTWLYFLNPMTPLILSSQRVIYAHPSVHQTTAPHALEQVLPPWPASGYALLDLGVLAGGLVLCYLALVLFRRLEGNFAEEL